MKLKRILTILLSSLMLTSSIGVAQADVLFWSTQAKPAQESQAMRDKVLKGANVKIDYQANDGGPWLTRLKGELQAGSGQIGVLGGLHGDFAAMNPDDLVDLSSLGVTAASGTFNDLAKLGTNSFQYIPWMQASYIMAANKKALPYLPKGANIDALSYDELIQWSANIKKETGEAKFGFPYLKEKIDSMECGAKILEVGCGTGILLSMLAEEFSQHELHGIEPFGDGHALFKDLNSVVRKTGVNIKIQAYEEHNSKKMI